MAMDDRMMDAVTEIRAFNRFYTGVIGLLGQHILDSGYSLTEARVLLEISRAGNGTANRLAEALGIDRSYMSRIVSKLEGQGLVVRRASKKDGRANDISLTDEGLRVFRDLDERSNEQAERLISGLAEEERGELRRAMRTIKKYLGAQVGFTIRPFREADVDYVIERQLSLYETERGFSSAVWKRYLREGVAAFVDRFDPELDNMYVIENNGAPAGCVAITHAGAETAQLRYFFLEPELRGLGAGQRLFDQALAFCREKGYRRVFLWTVSAQKAARQLYAARGFTITETGENSEWGVPVLEERWDLAL